MDAREQFKTIKPMLSVTADPFDSEEYLFEVKWDGFRCLSLVESGLTMLKSRNNLDFTRKFPELSSLHELIGKKPVILDGEIVIMEEGVPSFYQLQKRGWAQDPASIKRSARIKPATYVVFDILLYGTESMLKKPLSSRKEILGELVQQNEKIYVSEGILGYGQEFFRICSERNLEGIIAKKTDSLYIPGKRSPYWKKIKKSLEGEFIICGFKQTVKDSKRVDALILGILENETFIFQGAVGVGLGGTPGQILFKRVEPLKMDATLFPVPKDINRGIQWIKPVLCCSVQYLEVSKDGGLRHPVFRGLREDLRPEECTGTRGSGKHDSIGREEDTEV